MCQVHHNCVSCILFSAVNDVVVPEFFFVAACTRALSKILTVTSREDSTGLVDAQGSGVGARHKIS